jgi:hypothetical protein
MFLSLSFNASNILLVGILFTFDLSSNTVAILLNGDHVILDVFDKRIKH